MPKTKNMTESSAKSPESVKKAIKAGAKVITDHGSKIDAAMTIFRLIKDEPQQVITDAFIEGATLTPKGALTYWYLCKRRYKKESNYSV